MPEWVRTLLKWTSALVAMGLVVVLAVPRVLDELSQAVSFDMNGDGIAPLTTPTPADPEELPTISGELSAVAVASVRDQVVTGREPGTVTVGPEHADEVLLAFEPVPADPACIMEIELVIPLLEAPGRPETLVQPAAVGDFSALDEGQPLPGGTILESDEPVTGVPGEGAERLRYIATAPHAIATREAGAESLVVLSLSLVPDADGSVTVGTPTGEDERRPVITWTAVEDCPDAAPSA
jgi:hypothetical protein